MSIFCLPKQTDLKYKYIDKTEVACYYSNNGRPVCYMNAKRIFINEL